MTATGDPLPAEDLAFNALRLERVLDQLGPLAEPVAPLRLLDAGCGTGWLTRALAAAGHQVTGIDPVESAVQACRAQARVDGRDRYYLSTLEAWAPPYLYDCVVCLGVLDHMPDDPTREMSAVNLASLVRSGGRFLLANHDYEPRHYVELLSAEGLAYRRFVPYEPGDNDTGLYVFDRIT